MRYVEVGGLRVSAIGLGTWQFGSFEWGYGRGYANDEAGKIVARALDLGITLIDTAEMYAFGRSERIVGEAIRGRRDSVVLATKLFPVLPLAPIVEQRARSSAARLGVDTIDLYQIHWPNPIVPDGPAMD
ncbi:MAG TPA: aldo/keto reductase, partial [Acidimicrobiales bacterium]|nr:aldo/keto reductase [Acidimicrobiales bacterium]